MMGKRGKHGLRPGRVVLAVAALALAAALPGVASGGSIEVSVLYGGSYELEGQVRYAEPTGAPAVVGDRIYFPVSEGGISGATILVHDSQGTRPLFSPKTPVPDGTGVFSSIESIWVDGDDIAFIAQGSGGQEGVYVASPEGVRKIADRNTPIPGGTGNFTEYAYPNVTAVTIEDGRVAFHARGAGGQAGVYLHDGDQLHRVADTQTLIPGRTEHFSYPVLPRLAGGQVLFTSIEENNAIYSYSAGQLETFFEPAAAFPVATEAYVGYYDYDGVNLTAIVAPTSGDWLFDEIYHASPAGTRQLADLSLLIPGTSTPIIGFGDVAIDGQDTAFTGGIIGWSWHTPAVYWDRDGELYDVIGPHTDLITWIAQVVHYQIGPQGLDGNTLAFHVTTADIGVGRGLFVARYVPEPASSSTMLVGAALALLGGAVVRARRRRARS